MENNVTFSYLVIQRVSEMTYLYMSSSDSPLVNRYLLALGLFPVTACLLGIAYAYFSSPTMWDAIGVFMLPTALSFSLLTLVFGVITVANAVNSSARWSQLVMLAGLTISSAGMVPTSVGFLMRLLKYPNWDLFLYMYGGPILGFGVLVIACGGLAELFMSNTTSSASLSEN